MGMLLSVLVAFDEKHIVENPKYLGLTAVCPSLQDTGPYTQSCL